MLLMKVLAHVADKRLLWPLSVCFYMWVKDTLSLPLFKGEFRLKEPFCSCMFWPICLIDYAVAMQDCGFGNSEAPSSWIQSSEAFCIDTMAFEHGWSLWWLNVLKTMLELGADFTWSVIISPCWRCFLRIETKKVIHDRELLNRIDRL